MHTPVMRYYRSNFLRVIARRRKVVPGAWGTEAPQMIIYNAGAALLAAGKEINYTNMMDELLGVK